MTASADKKRQGKIRGAERKMARVNTAAGETGAASICIFFNFPQIFKAVL